MYKLIMCSTAVLERDTAIVSFRYSFARTMMNGFHAWSSQWSKNFNGNKFETIRRRKLLPPSLATVARSYLAALLLIRLKPTSVISHQVPIKVTPKRIVHLRFSQTTSKGWIKDNRTGRLCDFVIATVWANSSMRATLTSKLSSSKLYF